MSIVVNNLTKRYNDQLALDDISFEAQHGQITGLVGPNGAGKSTTMKILTCFIPATSGEARVCGKDVNDDSIDLRQQIGYLPEHNPLYKSMYVREYLNFVCKIHQIKDAKSAISRVIEKVGLTEERHKKINQLSKGYKQRVGIAQALIHDPKVLILDEPISGLDPNQLEEIRMLISGLKEDKTIIFSSHILQEVESICDKIVILNKGKIAADDMLANLKSKGIQELIEVEFLMPVEKSTLLSSFQEIGVESISKTQFILTPKTESDIRGDIFDFAVKHNNKLIGLQKRKSSLENVFKNVTKSQDN